MGNRFTPGAARPAQATTIAAPRTELLPGLDRPTIVFWLGASLIVATDIVDYGPLAGMYQAASGKTVKGAVGIRETVIEVFLIGTLWIVSQLSDSAGTFAILLLVALWVVWLVLHVEEVGNLLGGLGVATGATNDQGQGEAGPLRPLTK